MSLTAPEINKNYAIQPQAKILRLSNVHTPEDLLFTCGISGSDKIFSKSYDESVATHEEIFNQLLNQKTQNTIQRITTNLGISQYTPKLLTNEYIAMKDSQEHLLGLLKYMEGDGQYYYESHTNCYKDGGNYSTVGFGHAHTKEKQYANPNHLTQEESYELLLNDLQEAYVHTKAGVDKKLGKGTFDSLPNSIKEAFIDLSFNKGPAKVYQNQNIIRHIKNKNYVDMIPEMFYLYDNNGVKQKGLYKRSLARVILATRDLSEEDKKNVKPQITKLYQASKRAIKNPEEVNKMYNLYANNKFSKSAFKADGTFKIDVKPSWVGKNFKSVAKEIYEQYDYASKNISYEDFMKAYISTNNTRVKGKAVLLKNQDIKIPKTDYIKNRRTNNYKQEAYTDKPNWLERTWDKVKNGFSNLFNNTKGKLFKIITLAGSILTIAAGVITKNKNAIKFGTASLVGTIGAIFVSDKLQELKHNETKTNETETIKEEKKDSSNYDKHTVRQGETLFKISQKYNISVDTLKKLNNLNDNTIKVGEKLYVPKTNTNNTKPDTTKNVNNTTREVKAKIETKSQEKTKPTKKPTQKTTQSKTQKYTVKTKETLYSIATDNNTTVKKLKEANHLKNNDIKVGQEIIIPN